MTHQTPPSPEPSRKPARPKLNLGARGRSAKVGPSFSDGSEEGARPSRLLVAGIVGMCGLMAGAVISVWQAGLWMPMSASAGVSERTAGGHESIRASLQAARSYMTGGEWGKAEAVLNQAAEEFPLDQEIRIALGETLLGQKRYGEAYEQYAKALVIGPTDAKLEFTAGQVASTAGMHENAADHFDSAQRKDPYNTNYPLMLGMVERQLGRTDAAKTSLLRAANVDPQNAFAWGALADIALSENNVHLCVQHITKARSLQPNSREWRLVEARARKRLGEPEKALMLLLTLDESQKRESSVVRLMGECYGMLNRHADAAETWAAGSHHNPTDGVLAFEAAVALERAGEMSRALEFANRAKALGHEGAGKLLERLGG